MAAIHAGSKPRQYIGVSALGYVSQKAVSDRKSAEWTRRAIQDSAAKSPESPRRTKSTAAPAVSAGSTGRCRCGSMRPPRGDAGQPAPSAPEAEASAEVPG